MTLDSIVRELIAFARKVVLRLSWRSLKCAVHRNRFWSKALTRKRGWKTCCAWIMPRIVFCLPLEAGTACTKTFSSHALQNHCHKLAIVNPTKLDTNKRTQKIIILTHMYAKQHFLQTNTRVGRRTCCVKTHFLAGECSVSLQPEWRHNKIY